MEVLPDFEGYISEITLDELMAIKSPELKRQVRTIINQITILERTAEVDTLTDLYLTLRKMPRAEAMHLAFASFGEIHFLVTWNLKHLYKPITQEVVRHVNMRLRLPIPIIVTPENFFEEE